LFDLPTQQRGQLLQIDLAVGERRYQRGHRSGQAHSCLFGCHGILLDDFLVCRLFAVREKQSRQHGGSQIGVIRLEFVGLAPGCRRISKVGRALLAAFKSREGRARPTNSRRITPIWLPPCCRLCFSRTANRRHTQEIIQENPMTPEQARMRLTGAMTALVTPFTDGEVDLKQLTTLLRWQIEQGSTGWCRAAPPVRPRPCRGRSASTSSRSA